MSNITDDKIIQVFKYVDKANENSINKTDIPLAMRYLGFIKTKADFAFLLTNISDKINQEQFVDLIHKEKEKMIGQKELIEAFESLDEKKTGKISSKELYHVLTVIGEKLSKEDIEELNNLAKPDAEGNIEYKNLIDKLLIK